MRCLRVGSRSDCEAACGYLEKRRLDYRNAGKCRSSGAAGPRLARTEVPLASKSVHVEGPSSALEGGTVIIHAQTPISFDSGAAIHKEGVLKGEIRPISLIIVFWAEFKGITSDLRRRRIGPPQERYRHV